MTPFIHETGNRYLIMNGVRRAKAAQLQGHDRIAAEVVDRAAVSLGECEIPIDALLSPKRTIGRISRSDVTRWERADDGAKNSTLPFPPILVQPTKKAGTSLADVEFDFGDSQ